MAVNVGGALTRKLGPLPAWGWGVGIGGAILAVRVLRGGSISGGGGSGEPQRILVPSGGGEAMAAPDFVSELGTRIGALADSVAQIGKSVDELESQIGAPAPTAPTPTNPNKPSTPTTAKPKPAAFDLTTYVKALRRVFPAAAKLFPDKQPSKETAAQRTARLQRERDYIEAYAGVGDYDLTSYIKGLRRLFPTIAAQFTEKETAGETAAQRKARLEREKKFIEARAGVGGTSFLSFGTGVDGFPLGATYVTGKRAQPRIALN
jgi:hypothetical protein